VSTRLDAPAQVPAAPTPTREAAPTTAIGGGGVGNGTCETQWVWVRDPGDDEVSTATASPRTWADRLDAFVRSCMVAKLLGG
jgi:hypothetical protein